MSGTSADAIDAVLVRTDGQTAPELVATMECPYPEPVRADILALYRSGPDEIERLGWLDRQLGEQFAQAALAVIERAGMTPGQVDLIGSHGQTIRHRPPRFTLQIGNGSVISARTGITTVADFRPRDLVYGGQGAPLTPRFHQALFHQPGWRTVVVNLGGIANITALPADENGPLAAGDTGPANSLLDLLVTRLTDHREPCDRDGARASRGHVLPDALAWMLAHPYFTQPFPKSTGREIFGEEWLELAIQQFPALASDDGCATLTCFTAMTVADGCRQLLPPWPQRVVLCGGGCMNAALVHQLRQQLPHSHVTSTREFGVDPHSLEAQAFAWFAVRTLRGLPSSLPQATGASRESILGAIFPGAHD
jgi:anhydro-N-acetylmuramic acid kinase